MKTTWDLSKLFASDSDPEIAGMRAETECRVRAFAAKWEQSDAYVKSSDALFEALTEYEMLNREYGTGERVGYYWWLRSVQDQNDATVRGKLNEVMEWGIKLGNEIQFFPIRVARLEKTMREKVLVDPRFAPFKHYLERAFAEADHLLSEPE